ncbi:MAG: class I SAM-dependent methyltransferase [Curvibacter sp.]|jgi:SAM-dependent methyltransferase
MRPDTPASLPSTLRAIVERHPRASDPGLLALSQALARWDAGEDPARHEGIWQQLVEHILTRSHWLGMLFPQSQAEVPELIPLVQSLSNIACLPGARGEEAVDARRRWIAEQSDLSDTGSLLARLLRDLRETAPDVGPHFLHLSRHYAFLDLLVAHFVRPELKALHEQVFTTLHLQRAHWPHSYCSGYLYQGWEELGLCGIKPTDTRLRGYGIEELLQPGDRVLDLGANNGFLALALARRVAQVDAVEINPFLVDIGRAAARHLGPHKVRFILADIEAWSPLTLYDAVLSLANHSTIDQRMSMDFETYVAKLFSLLRPGGWLFFESHNVFGPGTGGPGDDGDLDRKFDIMERYFELVDASMHRSFVPAHDIDKLFVRLRRRAAYAPDVQRSFSLAHARTLYAD